MVRAVAAVVGTSPLALDPLYDAIDPEQLDETFERAGSGIELSFEFNGCDVTGADGEVHVRSREADADS